MPLVRRALWDIFALAPYVDIMVNPVNLLGVMGKGLAKEFADRHPHMYERYKAVCAAKKLSIGKLHVYHDAQMPYTVVNFPTKRHYADASDPEDLKRGLRELARWLREPQRYLHTVALPMLGCGEGKLGYEIAEPLFFDYLDGLDNVIHLSMLPEKMESIPKYLAIIGPRAWNNYADVEDGVLSALRHWNLRWHDFAGVVSGGAKGVDEIACGKDRTDISYQESLSKKYHSKFPIICKADWGRYGRAAGMVRNRTVIHIATHVVAILPRGVAAVGTTGAIALLRNFNKTAPADQQKQLYIHGIEAERSEEIEDRLIAPNPTHDSHRIFPASTET